MMNDDDYISMGLSMGMMTGCTSDVKDQKQYKSNLLVIKNSFLYEEKI